MGGPTDRGPADAWWRVFFESPDSLRLAFFPNEIVTSAQVAGLDQLMSPWQPQKVLDLCCGAGRHLIPLLQRGYYMVGLDVSSFMIGQAVSAAQAAGVPRRVVRGQAQQLPFGSCTFDAILCLFNSFGYLEDEENEEVVREVARCLRVGGHFLLDTRNRAHQLANLPFSEIVPLEGGGAVWLECSHDPQQDRLVSVFRSVGTGRQLYRASIRIYSLSELEAILQQAGLTIDSIYGGYDWRPFRGDSREVLILAHK